jgi:hypothetical protein
MVEERKFQIVLIKDDVGQDEFTATELIYSGKEMKLELK